MNSPLTEGSNFARESELLLSLVRPTFSDEAAGRVRGLLREELDWKWLLSTADEHRVVPLVYNRLRGFQGLVPAGPIDILKHRAREISNKSLALTGKLISLLARLREHNIPAIAYKGPTLAQAAFGDPCMRQFGDLDILIRKKDFYRVRELFLSNGCEPAWKLTEAQEGAVLRHYYEYPFVSNERRILIEVHWQFAEDFFSFGFDFDDIWRRIDSVLIKGKSLPTLSIEDLLLVLCAHGTKHGWKRLNWIEDIAQLITVRNGLDWALIIERATAFGLRRMLCLALLTARELLRVDLPELVQIAITAEPEIAELFLKIKCSLFTDTEDPAKEAGNMAFQLKVRERLADRVRYGFRLIVMTRMIDSLFMPMGRPR